MSDLKLLEFCCPVHGRFEQLVERAADPDEMPCPMESVNDSWKCCYTPSPWVMSAPMVRKLTIAVQAVTTGKSDPRPPGMLDTRKLGLEGQSMRDWNKERDAEDRNARHKWIKKEFG